MTFHATVSDSYEISGRCEGEAGGSVTSSTSESAASGLFPCSYTQLRIWYQQALDPDGSHWNVAMRWRLDGDVRAADVQRAWHVLTSRHEILRTTIEDVDGVPHQRVWDRLPVRFVEDDVTTMPADRRGRVVDEIGREEALRPLPLDDAGSLVRIRLVRVGRSKCYLFTTFHHLLVDGWSIGVLIREFAQVLSAIGSGGPVALPDVGLQHVDYTLWQADLIANGGLEADRAYWRQHLAGWQRFEVPTDRPRTEALSGRGDIRSILLPMGLSKLLPTFVASHGLSMFQLATGTLAAVLVEAAGSTDVLVGTVVACRDDDELQGLVGPLINTVPLRIDAGGDPTVLQLLQRTRERALAAASHQNVPFNFIVEDANVKRDPSRAVLHGITVTAQAAHIDAGDSHDIRVPGFVVSALPSYSVGAAVDLEFFMVGRDEGWRISCNANTDLYDRATVDRLLMAWARSIETAVIAGDTRLSKLAEQPLRRYIAGGIGCREVAAASASPSPSAATESREPTPGAVVSMSEEPAALVETSEPAVSVPPVPATDPKVAKVIAIWSELLGAANVGPETDFFDAGGNSLIAMRMLARVNKALGCRATVPLLFGKPVLSDFVANIPGQAPAPVRVQAPVPVKATAGAAPAISATPAKSQQSPILALNNGSAYVHLARQLGGSDRIVDVFCGTEDDIEIARRSPFEAMIARVADRVVAAQPKGPYTIIAYCALGIVAAEVARKLKADGHEIRLVALLNSQHPSYRSQLTTVAKCVRFARRLTEAIYNVGVLAGMRWRGQISTAVAFEHYGFIRATGLTQWLIARGLIDPLPPQEESVVGFAFFDALLPKVPAGIERRYDFPMVVFHSREMLTGPLFPAASGWAAVTYGDIFVRDLTCQHNEVTGAEAAKQIAPLLQRIIDDVSSRPDGTAGKACGS